MKRALGTLFQRSSSGSRAYSGRLNRYPAYPSTSPAAGFLCIRHLSKWKTSRDITPDDLQSTPHTKITADYTGGVKDGLKHGNGTLVHPQYTYKGDWVNDVREGLGEMIYADGRTYLGEFKAGKRDGKGKLTYSDGSTYTGEWKEDMKHGQGVLVRKGLTWKGEFRNNDPFEGHGTFVDGNVMCEGTWVNGLVEGKATKHYEDGGIYAGEMKGGLRHGDGIYTYKGLGLYNGHWEHDKKHGIGRFDYTDGSHYEGHWKGDERHGMGKLTTADGTIYDGHFEHGIQHGKGTTTFPNEGGMYHGDYLNGFPHGHGREVTSLGLVYEGEWACGLKHGSGTISYQGGDTFTGSFVKGKRHGPGVFTALNGDSVQQDWVAGEIVTPLSKQKKGVHKGTSKKQRGRAIDGDNTILGGVVYEASVAN